MKNQNKMLHPMTILRAAISGKTTLTPAEVRYFTGAVHGIDWKWCDHSDPYDLLLSGKADVALIRSDELLVRLPDMLTVAALTTENLAVICCFHRADLRGLFYSLDVRNSYGRVWLLGAGPGSADLITVRGARVLAQADIVFYDDLVDCSLLNSFRGESVYVGKRKGRASHSQDSINELLYRSALEGKRVVRLKGGDPSVFGRAGEELDYLRRRWITVEMVPGVTSASAGAAAGLLSLTQRKISRSINLRSGHGMTPDRQQLPGNHTYVYYMAASKLSEIANELMHEGVSSSTPVAVISNAGAWNEACIRGTVKTMKEIAVWVPAIVIIGNVAEHAHVERKALFTGTDPAYIQIKESIIHQPLAAYASGRVEARTEKLDLSYFAAVFFSTPSEVEAFKALYGELPDHLLCYATDRQTRKALEKAKVNGWRIVGCPARGKRANTIHRVA